MLHQAADSAHCNSIWILENAKVNRGGSVRFGVAYRLRHLASSCYLTVVKGGWDRSARLAVSPHASCTASRESLFLLYPLDSDTMGLSSTTPVQLRHEATGRLPIVEVVDGAREPVFV